MTEAEMQIAVDIIRDYCRAGIFRSKRSTKLFARHCRGSPGPKWWPRVNGAWATLAAKPALDSDVRRRLDINSKPVWAPVLEWRTRELRERFSDAVVAAVCRAHPSDLD